MIERFNIEKCKKIALERGYEILSDEYFTTTGKMIFYHIKCENKFLMDWNHFNTRKQGCDICGKKERGIKRRIDENICIEYAGERGYTFIDEYYPENNAGKHINVIHNDCNTKFSVRWQDFKSGKGCPKCFGNTKLTIEFCKIEASKFGFKILSEEYHGNHIPMLFRHLECDHEFFVEWNSFYNRGSGCPKCSGLMTLTIEHCREHAEKRGYAIESDTYINNRSHLDFVHAECGFLFSTAWATFQQGSGCPKCAREKQESSMATILKKYYLENFDAIEEYDECINPKTGNYLPYDIFIPKYNNQGHDIFIEVQGHQHYKFNSVWHKDLKDFKYQKYKDRIKRKYAEQNGIYIEIDLRQKTPIEDIIQKINTTIQTYS